MTTNMENNAALEIWLKQATCSLSPASAVTVRSEIGEHFESAKEASLIGGTSAEEAARQALASLGDAKQANRQYRKVLLTVSEDKLLRKGTWEAQAICSRPWLRWLFSIFAVCVGIWLISKGEASSDWALLVGLSGMAILPLALFLPIYTPARGRLFRYAKWAWLAVVLVAAAQPDAGTLAWMLPCMWPIFWIEWTNFSLRRKLPVERWPKQLYL